jgi:hypothetical protein
MRFAVVDARVNRLNVRQVQEFTQLVTASTARKLKPNEAKRFARLQTQLMRTGVIMLLTKQVVTDHARALYAAMPWWKRAKLRVFFHLRVLRGRLNMWKLRLKS